MKGECKVLLNNDQVDQLTLFHKRCNELYNKAVGDRDFRLAFDIAVKQYHEASSLKEEIKIPVKDFYDSM